MKRDFYNLNKFMNERVLDAHPDYDYTNEGNCKIARIGIDRLVDVMGLKPGSSIIDVGCGKGRDTFYMKERGLYPTGLNFLASELVGLETPGINFVCGDQSFMEFDNDTFDCVWSRHCLEHSILPFFTLVEYNRVLKMGGLCYVELPAPDTVKGLHETNPNHYSVMGKNMWKDLFIRSGFGIAESYNIDFTGVEGDTLDILIDTYYVFILQKTSLPACGWFRDHTYE